MTPDIDPSHATSVLEVLKIAKTAPDEAWADIRSIKNLAGQTRVAVSIRSIYDDGLIVRHVSGLREGESIAEGLQRAAVSLSESGLRSVDILPGDADTDEEFHNNESLRRLKAITEAALPTTLH